MTAGNTPPPNHETGGGWRKSSRSNQDGGCIELAGTLRAIRDSKHPGPILAGHEQPLNVAAFIRSITS